MKKLLKGIVEFRKDILPRRRESFRALAKGQKPDALFIACSDSRVVPNLFASTNPGELFVIRNVGNLVPSAESKLFAGSEGAAVEFANSVLKVKDIIICGHSECGACQALLGDHGASVGPHLDHWLSAGQASVEAFQKGRSLDPSLSPHNQLSQLNALLQLENLKTYSLVRERWERGELGLHAWWFDIAEGDVYTYDPELDRFVVIDAQEADRLLSRLTS